MKNQFILGFGDGLGLQLWVTLRPISAMLARTQSSKWRKSPTP